jgi:hypothetical protein
MSKNFQHNIKYGEALARIGKYLGYSPEYALDNEPVELGDLEYNMDEEIILEFDVIHGSTTTNQIDIIFKDGKRLTPLPF